MHDLLMTLVKEKSENKCALVKVFGKTGQEHRLKAYFGKCPTQHYKYSGVTQVNHGWPDIIDQLATIAEAECAKRGAGGPAVKFTRALVNYYRTGRDYIGRHYDKDGLVGTIGSFSFYPAIADGKSQCRIFRISRKSDNALVWNDLLPQGSLFIMKPSMQEFFEHECPPMATIETGRINVTLREDE